MEFNTATAAELVHSFPGMKRPFSLSLAAFLVCSTISAQTNKSSLKALYGKPKKGSFVVTAGVKLVAVYDSDDEACVLTISGPISEQDLMKLFDKTVPPKARGVKQQDLDMCAGPCEHVIDYEKVNFTSGVIGTRQTSDPDALIVFKRKDCETAARAAKATGFSMRRTER